MVSNAGTVHIWDDTAKIIDVVDENGLAIVCCERNLV